MEYICSQYDHVVWDWNGTITDDTELCVRLVNELLTGHGLQPVSLEAYRRIFDFPVKDYYARLGFDFEKESFEELGARWIKAYDDHRYDCPIHEGALEAIQRLHERGVPQSIISAYELPRLKQIVRHFELDRYMTELVGRSDPWADGKLHLGQAWMERSGLDSGRVLLLGDTVHDYEMAEAMGIDCILIARGHQERKKLESCGAYVLDSHLELFDWAP